MTVLLDIERFGVGFQSRGGLVRAVRDVSYTLAAGETLGIVGESGSGKSSLVLGMLGLLPGRPVLSGSARFRGQDLLAGGERHLRKLRGRDIGFVFQDPMSSLNPVLTIGRQIAEPLIRHKKLGFGAALARAGALLDTVGIADPDRVLQQYPHQLSGGMRQRVMFAAAIACEPALLIADEPTTALDVTVQDQILCLARDLQAKSGMAIIWITHDLGVIAGLADTVQVMYAGQIVERGPSRALFHDPRHAYTWSLLEALPARARTGERLRTIEGLPPDPREAIIGDAFAARNPFATPRCHREAPPLTQVAGGAAGHLAAAWYDLPAVLAARGQA